VLRQRRRSSTALAAIALGVAAMIIAGGFINDVYVQFADAIIHSQYGHLQIHRKGYTAHGTQRPGEYVIDSPSAVIASARSIPEVRLVLSRLRFVGTANAQGGDLPIVGEGIQSALESRLGTYIEIVDGRALREGDLFAVIIGIGAATALHVRSGARVTLNVVSREGALNSLEFEVVGIFRSQSKEFDEHAVRLPLEAAQELLVTSGINEVVVELGNTPATERVGSQLNARVASEGYEVKTWTELADFYTKTVQLFDRQYGFLQIVLLLMIALSVSNTINAATFERMPEFGTMIALGDRWHDVFRLVLVECLVLGIVGSMLGLIVGCLLALGISAVGIDMPPPPNTHTGYTAYIRIVPSVVASAFLVGTISAALAGLAPSFRIARTPPVEALRRAI
jgi:putative ABC transport system permease protein